MPTPNTYGRATTALAFAIALTPFAAQAADYTMKIGFTTVNDPFNAFAQRLEQEIEKRSDNRIDVELYPGGQLGTAAREIEGLQIGTQEMFISPPGFFAGMDPSMQVLDAPGVFHSMDHAQAVLNDPELRKAYFDLLEPSGILILAQWAYGPSAIATMKPVGSVTDLEGMKIRVLASPLEQELAKSLGMTGVSMDFTEALPALQTGTIDGVRTALSVMGGMKFYDTAKFALKEETGMILGGAFASKIWLDGLPDDLRTMVIDTVAGMQDEAMQLGKQGAEKADKDWRAAGVTVVDLTAEQRADLFAKVSPIGAKFLSGNSQAAPLWTVFQGALDRHPPQM